MTNPAATMCRGSWPMAGVAVRTDVAIEEGLVGAYDSHTYYSCLADAHPEVMAALDAEREAKAQSPIGAGICEVAEGKPGRRLDNAGAPLGAPAKFVPGRRSTGRGRSRARYRGQMPRCR